MASTHSIDLERSSSQYLSAADSASLSITGDLTIEGWIKLESAPGSGETYAIAGKNTSSGNQLSYVFSYFNNAGTRRLQLFVDSTGNATLFDTLFVNTTITVGTWTHVAVTWDTNGTSSSTATFYVNGSSIGTDTSAIFTIFDSTSPFAIGANGGSGEGDFFDGLIDDVRVWNVVRTGTQINNNQCTEIDSATNLQGSWHLNNSLVDSSGNGNTLTNNNSAVFVTDVPACLAPTTSIKTFNGLANASVKTVNGLARASVKTWNGLA